MYIPPHTSLIFIVGALLFGSAGLAFAIVWFLKQQRAPAPAEKEKTKGNALERAKTRSNSDGKERPMKRVYEVGPELIDREAEDENAEQALEETEDQERECEEAESKKPRQGDTGSRGFDVNQLREIPNTIPTEEGSELHEFLEEVTPSQAAEAIAQGAFIFVSSPAGGLSRAHSVADLPNDDKVMMFELVLPALTSHEPAVFSGSVVEHGRAPYLFKKGNSPSYYVKLDEGRRNPRVLWGVDLERAIKQGSIPDTEGAAARFTNRGFQWVTVDVPKEKGGGRELKTVKRNVWEAVSAERDNPLPKDTSQQNRGQRR